MMKITLLRSQRLSHNMCEHENDTDVIQTWFLQEIAPDDELRF